MVKKQRDRLIAERDDLQDNSEKTFNLALGASQIIAIVLASADLTDIEKARLSCALNMVHEIQNLN